jgi:hypothetical protein
MMTCKQFRESLDCYVDGELSVTATAAADSHRRECQACDRAVTSLLAMRSSLKQATASVRLPAGLERRVRTVLMPHWLRPFAAASFAPRRSVMAIAAVALLAVVLATITRPPVDATAANAMDRLALRLDDSSPVVVEGTVLCRDCELEHRYGIKSSCRQIGHHGAIFTADGRILNLVEQRASSRLIHDETLFGKKVIVHGRIFRGARALVVDSFQLEG